MAVRPHSLDDAVKLGNEYLQVQAYTQSPQPGLTRIYNEQESCKQEEASILVAQATQTQEPGSGSWVWVLTMTQESTLLFKDANV